MQQAEAKEQQVVVEYCRVRHIPIFAIPNGGKRNAKEAYYMKLSGVTAGVPDLCVRKARRGYHALFIEMKYGNNKLTAEQKQTIAELNEDGYLARVCYSAEEAIKLIDWYFGGDK